MSELLKEAYKYWKIKKLEKLTNSKASIPGKIFLSLNKLEKLYPEFLKDYNLLEKFQAFKGDKTYLSSLIMQLICGACTPAVVIKTSPLLVAAYAYDIDCVSVLQYPDFLVEEYNLEVGARLLSVNLYYRKENLASDLEAGPETRNTWNNFSPAISDFLSYDKDQIKKRKKLIEEKYWERAFSMGLKYIEKNNKYRNGSPTESYKVAF